MSSQNIVQIEIADIVEPRNCMRTQIVLEGLEELADSIRAVGVINPLHVRRAADKYEIVAGHRRYLASKMAGLSQLPCLITELPEDQADLVKLHENYCREEVSPVDEGEWFAKLKRNQGWDTKAVAAFVRKSESYVAARLALVRGDPRVLEALSAGQIKFSQAKEILVADNEDVRLALLKNTVQSGCTVSVIRQLRRDYENIQASGSTEPLPETPVGEFTPAPAYQIECVSCKNKFPVVEIYPVSFCRGCREGLLSALAGGGPKGDRGKRT